MGTLFPPLAVAARFGIGKDFWLNLLLTICGYIPGVFYELLSCAVLAQFAYPGHGHNFYIQNIRNNKNHARTPKWAQRYGLVDTSTIERHQRRSQWANRYNDRLPQSTLENQAFAEGQEQASSVDLHSSESNPQRQQSNGGLWRPEDESYYNADTNSSGSHRWHYPANFEDAAVPTKRKKDKKVKKDRWARTEDAYSQSGEGGKKSRRRKKDRSSVADNESRDSVAEFPEDPEGGLYAEYRNEESTGRKKDNGVTGDDVFQHQF
ncbi:hypothetical protein H0H93_001553 [Arthromyces matolae]|nr:hypothetical protein H0H93_001553 [Arthromyces matolae]